MRASNPVEESRGREVVPLGRNLPEHHATPVYAHGNEEGTGAFEIRVDVRGWSVQALQWLIIFAVLGLLIGGAKWWSPHEEAAIAPLVTAPPPATTTTAPAEGDRTTADVAPDPGSFGEAPAESREAAFASSTAPAALPQMPDGSVTHRPASDELAAPTAGAAAGTIDAPTVRAPADLPYPRRIHDVTPEVPEGAAVRRGIAVLTLLIDTSGDVAEVELLRSLDPVLDEAAIAAAWQWKFEPTLRDGQPVAVRSNFTVRFGH